jgi:hypothetical protein
MHSYGGGEHRHRFGIESRASCPGIFEVNAECCCPAASSVASNPAIGTVTVNTAPTAPQKPSNAGSIPVSSPQLATRVGKMSAIRRIR